MDYNVLETNIKFNPDGSILHLLALVEMSKGDIRVLEASQQKCNGYMSISNRTDHILYDLLQDVAVRGIEVTDISKIPIEWRKFIEIEVEEVTVDLVTEINKFFLSPSERGESYIYLWDEFTSDQIEYLNSLIQKIEFLEDGNILVPKKLNPEISKDFYRIIGSDFDDLFRVFNRMNSYYEVEKNHKLAILFIDNLKKHNYGTTLEKMKKHF